MRKLAILAGCAVAAATALLVLYIHAHSKNAPGFIGPGVLSADVNLTLEIVLVLGLTFGFYLARSGNIEAHRVNQTIWVLVNTVLVALIMVPSLQGMKVKSIADLANTGIWITLLHALIGTFSVIAGLWLVLQMNDVLPQRFHISGWKNLMRLTLAAYWAVAALGIATYYFWYAA